MSSGSKGQGERELRAPSLRAPSDKGRRGRREAREKGQRRGLGGAGEGVAALGL